MKRFVPRLFGRTLGVLCGAALLSLSPPSWGQAPAGTPRRLAEGVLKIVPAAPNPADVIDGPLQLPELSRAAAQLNWTPQTVPDTVLLTHKVDNGYVKRRVWQLEFGYKPLRTIRVRLAAADGSESVAVVWYLLYDVKNAGNDLVPVPQEADPGGYQLVELQESQQVQRFLPTFTLLGHDRAAEYSEQILPAAVTAIRRRETPNQPLYDSVTISRVSLPATGEGDAGRVWGVATWSNVDASTDFLSLTVQGLTNAYRIDTSEGRPSVQHRTLRLYFWRPGDELDPDDDRIRFGIPYVADPQEQSSLLEAYGAQERLDYEWIYR